MLLRASLSGTAPWYVGCYARPPGKYEVLWEVIGPAAKYNPPQPTEATFFFLEPSDNNIIRLKIQNLTSGSTGIFYKDYKVQVTKNLDAGVLSNFAMTKAALKAGDPTGCNLNVTVMLPCIKWDFDDGLIECNRDLNKNHTYQSPKVYNGKVTVHMPTAGGCDCKSDPVGSKEFSVLVYQS